MEKALSSDLYGKQIEVMEKQYIILDIYSDFWLDCAWEDTRSGRQSLRDFNGAGGGLLNTQEMDCAKKEDERNA
jgi:hypothetical protein